MGSTGTDVEPQRRGARSTAGVSATPRRCPGPPTPRPTPRSKKRSKKLPGRVEEVRTARSGAGVELWAKDEMRLGLKPVLRRMWAPPGKSPLARVRRRY